MTSLPKVEYVALFDPETKETRFARWDRLVEVAGELMEPEDCYPPRWLVGDFPSDDQIEETGAEEWSRKE